MTKIPSVEERMAEFTLFGVHSYIERTDDTELLPIDEFFSGVVENEKGETVVLSDWLRKTLTADRTALLTELRESGLLEEKDEWYTVPGSESEHGKITSRDKRIIAHNTLAKAIKAHLDELIKSNSI